MPQVLNDDLQLSESDDDEDESDDDDVLGASPAVVKQLEVKAATEQREIEKTKGLLKTSRGMLKDGGEKLVGKIETMEREHEK